MDSNKITVSVYDDDTHRVVRVSHKTTMIMKFDLTRENIRSLKGNNFGGISTSANIFYKIRRAVLLQYPELEEWFE